MNSRLQTLVILSPGFPDGEADDTCLPERQVFVKSLKQQYPQLQIIVLAFHYPYRTKEYEWNGITVIPFGGKNKGKVNRLIVWYKVWQILKRLNNANDIIGLLHFWLGECALVGGKFAKRYGIKQYSWLLGQDARKGNKYAKWINPNAENLIALSDFLAEEFYRNYSIKPRHIITPGIAVNQFQQSTFHRNIDILGVGSLIALKQYDLFIAILKSLSISMPHIKAVICGKGPDKQKLLQQIRLLQLQSNITLLDEMPHDEVLQLMQQSKVLLHTSNYEGWSTVCMEGLYAGAHVVAFCQPMKEPIQNMHIAASKEEILQKITAILSDNNRTHTPILPYSINETVDKVMKLYLH